MLPYIQGGFAEPDGARVPGPVVGFVLRHIIQHVTNVWDAEEALIYGPNVGSVRNLVVLWE